MSEGGGDASPSPFPRFRGDASPSLSEHSRGDGSGGVRKNVSKFPKYGWKVKLNHEFPEKRNPFIKPSISE